RATASSSGTDGTAKTYGLSGRGSSTRRQRPLPFEEGPLGRVGAELDGAVVDGDGVLDLAGPGEQIGPRRVVRLVRVEGGAVKLFEGGQPGLGAVALPEGDGPVEGDDGVRAHGEQLVVQGDDLRPVSRCS